MIILTIIFTLTILVLLYKLIKKYKNITQKTETSKESESSLNNEYNNINPSKLSEEDKIEMSWEFLYNINDKVKKHFNQNEKNRLSEIGKKLVEYGMQYNHSVKNWYLKYQNNNKIKIETKTKDDKMY